MFYAFANRKLISLAQFQFPIYAVRTINYAVHFHISNGYENMGEHIFNVNEDIKHRTKQKKKIINLKYEID